MYETKTYLLLTVKAMQSREADQETRLGIVTLLEPQENQLMGRVCQSCQCSGLWTLLQCHPCNPGTQLIQLLQPNPVKTKPADDPKSSDYSADPNPPIDALSTDTFTFHKKKINSTKKKILLYQL